MIEENWIQGNWIDRSKLVLMDAKLLAYAAWLSDDGSPTCGVRREDVVPLCMDDAGFDSARRVALGLGWIAKNPHGPVGRGCRYYAAGLSPDLCLTYDTVRLHCGPHEKDCFAEFHYEQVQDMLMSMPGTQFGAAQLKREEGGPCTDATWPLIREMLNDDDSIDKRGSGSRRTYSFIHDTMCWSAGWGELAPDYYLADFLTSWGDSDSETEGVA